jgi:hypothetical protein
LALVFKLGQSCLPSFSDGGLNLEAWEESAFFSGVKLSVSLNSLDYCWTKKL